MALYSLPFGHADWPVDTPSAREPYADPEPAPRAERLTLDLPAALSRVVERSAALDGVPTETWIVRALARSADPRVA